jgi:hypothetical protein
MAVEMVEEEEEVEVAMCSWDDELGNAPGAASTLVLPILLHRHTQQSVASAPQLTTSHPVRSLNLQEVQLEVWLDLRSHPPLLLTSPLLHSRLLDLSRTPLAQDSLPFFSEIIPFARRKLPPAASESTLQPSPDPIAEEHAAADSSTNLLVS